MQKKIAFSVLKFPFQIVDYIIVTWDYIHILICWKAGQGAERCYLDTLFDRRTVYVYLMEEPKGVPIWRLAEMFQEWFIVFGFEQMLGHMLSIVLVISSRNSKYSNGWLPLTSLKQQ